MCECQKHFARWEDGAQAPLPCFQGRQGEELTRSLLQVESTFDGCLQTLSEGAETILDVKNTSWHYKFNEYVPLRPSVRPSLRLPALVREALSFLA